MKEIEMSTGETMDALSLTESNVKVRLTRAKEMLRQAFSTHYKSAAVFNFHQTRCYTMAMRVMAQINRIESDFE